MLVINVLHPGVNRLLRCIWKSRPGKPQSPEPQQPGKMRRFQKPSELKNKSTTSCVAIELVNASSPATNELQRGSRFWLMRLVATVAYDPGQQKTPSPGGWTRGLVCGFTSSN
jgi:hypothetical protein